MSESCSLKRNNLPQLIDIVEHHVFAKAQMAQQSMESRTWPRRDNRNVRT